MATVTDDRLDRLDLLPPPAVVQDRLADALKDVALLRRQLRLSAEAEEERARRVRTDPTHPTERNEP
jgi:hypothetical protein